MLVKGRTWFLGNDIDTDQIMPTRWLALRTPEELGPHALTGNDPEWPQRVTPGDILVAGRNFGCGSSREHAPLGLKGLGLACVVAQSFSRIFYRNAVNVGLPLLVVRDDIAGRSQGCDGWVDVELGLLSFDDGTQRIQGAAPAAIVLEILAAGGLMARIAERRRAHGDSGVTVR